MGHSRIVHHASALAALALLSGCELDREDPRICLSPPSEITQGDIKACVHKWAYRLAPAPGPNSDIVEAAIQACDDVALWKSRQMKDIQAMTREYNQMILLARDQALFRVVQARAGHCEIP